MTEGIIKPVDMDIDRPVSLGHGRGNQTISRIK